MGKKFPVPSVHAVYILLRVCSIYLPCFPDYHAPPLVVSVFQLPGPTVPRAKREDVIDVLLYFRSKDRITGHERQKVLTFVVVAGPTSCIECTVQLGYAPPLGSPLWRNA